MRCFSAGSKYEAADLLPGSYWKEAVSKLNSRQQHSVEWVVVVDQEGKLKVTSNAFAQEAAEHDVRSFTPDQIPVGYKSVYEYRSFVQRQVEEANKAGVENKWAVNERARIGEYDEVQWKLEDQKAAEELAQQEKAGPSKQQEKQRAQEVYGRGMGDLIIVLNLLDENVKNDAQRALDKINGAVNDLKSTPAKDYEHLMDLACGMGRSDLIASAVKIEDGKYVLNEREVDRLVREAAQSKDEEIVVNEDDDTQRFETTVTSVVVDRVERDVDESGSGESVDAELLSRIKEDITLPTEFYGFEKGEKQNLVDAYEVARVQWNEADASLRAYLDNKVALASTVEEVKQAYIAMTKVNGALIEAINTAVTVEVHTPYWTRFSPLHTFLRPSMRNPKIQSETLGRAQGKLLDKMRATYSVLQTITSEHRADGGEGVLEELPDPYMAEPENLDSLRKASKRDVERKRVTTQYNVVLEKPIVSPIRDKIRSWFK